MSSCNDGGHFVEVDYEGVDDTPEKSEGGCYEGEGAPLHYRKPASKSALVRVVWNQTILMAMVKGGYVNSNITPVGR